MRVVYLAPARAKLLSTIAQMASESPAYARRFRGKLTLALLRLLRHPELGHRVPEAPDRPVRQFLIDQFRFFYAIDKKQRTIVIVEVWHGAQLAQVPELPADLEP